MADYEFLTAENIPAYIAAHPAVDAVMPADAVEQIDEIGDGNLNLVFRVRGGGHSVILKQALPYVRMTGEGWPMTPERATREAESLQRHHAIAGDVVVEIIEYDPARYVIAMEDLSDHRVWRDALNAGQSHDGVAAALGRYVAAVATRTSVLGTDRTQIAAEIASSQNPDLCIITEDLVFTEPAVDAGRNVVAPGAEAAAAELAADTVFADAMAEAKWRFMTHAEALIHGDLHTGSVMVRGAEGAPADSVKVFDSEFAFYGPVAYDLGALVANYVFAAARAFALDERGRGVWMLDQIALTLRAFSDEFLALSETWPDRRVWGESFAHRRVQTMMRETHLFAAAELARRSIGAARVRDVETLEDPLARAAAVRAALHAAREVAARWESLDAVTDLAGIVLPILDDTFPGN